MIKNAAKISVEQFTAQDIAFLQSQYQLALKGMRINCVDGAIIGTGRSDYTQCSTEYKLKVDDNDFLLIDIPGIEGDETKYKQIIKDSLSKAHMIFYVNGSGKKVEADTLTKIRDYMHDGTSVYAIFNVHCPAKMNPVPGLDKPYHEELADAYNIQNAIVKQTEAELKSFLGKNFKGSISVNGLLAFCANAIDCNGRTTIVEDEDKNLRANQRKFTKAYSGDLKAMYNDSHIDGIRSAITDKIEHFDEYILEENLKKLKTRLSDMLTSITAQREVESKKIREFLGEYDMFERNCNTAKEDFIQSLRRVGRQEVCDAFSQLQDELFQEAERSGGKPDKDVVRHIVESHQNQISWDIEQNINNKVSSALRDYEEALKEAEERLYKDLERSEQKFRLNMQAASAMLSGSVMDLDFGLKLQDLFKGATKIAKYTFSGFKIGTVIPVLGNVIGACVGFLVGIGMAIWGIFASREKKINKAKAQIKESIDNQVDTIVGEITRGMKNSGMEDQIRQKHKEIVSHINNQRAALDSILRMLDVVMAELNHRYNSIHF